MFAGALMVGVEIGSDFSSTGIADAVIVDVEMPLLSLLLYSDLLLLQSNLLPLL